MNLLALDTSSNACSVALKIGDDVSALHEVQPKQHTRILVPMVTSLLSDAGASLHDLAAVVLGNGPGSFIGMRIGASVAQGLAFGSGLKIVPVSSMAAVAAEVMDRYSAARVVVAQDARMNEAYLGVYRADEHRQPVAETQETLQPIEAIEGLAGEDAKDTFAAGQGWQKYAELLELNRAAIFELVDVHYPRANYLLGLGAAGLQEGTAIEPDCLAPAYIREKVAHSPSKTVTEL
ncbi:MAG: tRNA (adenosine(37)-N6)-threonylcarbamoyltransferase complex dimerization subunit type 1 TsaB [Woeseia sp.]